MSIGFGLFRIFKQSFELFFGLIYLCIRQGWTYQHLLKNNSLHNSLFQNYHIKKFSNIVILLRIIDVIFSVSQQEQMSNTI